MKTVNEIRDIIQQMNVTDPFQVANVLLDLLEHIDMLEARTEIKPTAPAPRPKLEKHYDNEKAKTRKYNLTNPVHPETVVRWFLDLVHYWFDETLGDNLFTGQRDAAFKYLCGWIETGELPPDKTMLEIQVAAKFQEWLKSSWKLSTAKCLASQPNVDYATAECCTFDTGHKGGHSWETLPEFAPAIHEINYTKPHAFVLDKEVAGRDYQVCKCGLSKQNSIHR